MDDGINGVPARQGKVDLVSTSTGPLEPVAVTAKAEAITEVLEDAHVSATPGTNHLGILARPSQMTGNELPMAAGILTSIALSAPTRIDSEPVDWPTAARTANVWGILAHFSGSFRIRGVNLEKPMNFTTSCHERSSEVNNLRLMR